MGPVKLFSLNVGDSFYYEIDPKQLLQITNKEIVKGKKPKINYKESVKTPEQPFELVVEQTQEPIMVIKVLTAQDIKKELLRLINLHDNAGHQYEGLKHGIKCMIINEIPDE